MSADYELHTLAGPFVMDAVTPGEREEFVRHLSGCAQCRDDVRELREATARLGMAAARKPRPELREQTIRAAFLTSQLAPVAPEPRSEHREEAQRPGTPRWQRLARRGWPTSLAARLALAAAALVIAAVTSFGLLAHSAMQQLNHSQRQDHVIATVLTAPDKAVLTSKVSTGGSVTVVMSHREHCLVFVAHGLSRLPGGQAYELWLMGPYGNRPAGMFKPVAGGMAGPAVVFGLSPGDAIGLSIEPASGSAEPTSVLVVVISPRG